LNVLLELLIVMLAAKLGGDLVERFGQPAVLGELVGGVLLGNLDLSGITLLEHAAADHTFAVLASLGAVLLLFEVGLESTVRDMMRVGVSATVVAVVGVVVPFALGFLVAELWMPERGPYVALFLGATLTATSVGITARVLKDLGRGQTGEARVILGAAVVDDVLGLVILAVVSGVVVAADKGGDASWVAIGLVFAKAAVFLLGALALGSWVSPRLFQLVGRFRGDGLLLPTALAFAFVLAWIAGKIGLAPIVGAYAAGLVLEPVHYEDLAHREEVELEDLVRPVAALFVPVFFVRMGMQVDLATFASVEVLGMGAILTAVAIVGKLVTGLVVGRGLDRLTIAVGMVPRGEVGLIFANVGLTTTLGGRPIVDAGLYAAIVLMVIATTFVTPIALRGVLARADRLRGAISVDNPPPAA
jgi:Kef-type K+ transport system membrane component KefB